MKRRDSKVFDLRTGWTDEERAIESRAAKGTRLFEVFAVSHDLLLVKGDGRLKVVRAAVPKD
ncbi:MAG: hypothetical protein ACJ74Q_01985 [Pyrinomonadaceae bacterium]